MSNRNYCDIIYAWFQCNSFMDTSDGSRYIPIKDVKYSQMGRQLEIDRRTISKYVKSLISMGLLEEEVDNKIFRLTKLESNIATLVPFPTLRALTNALSRNSVNIFVYLLNRFLGSGEEPFVVTHYELKSKVGLATTTTSNNIVINDILDILKRLGLITYELKQVEYDKTNIIIKSVTNVLPTE